MSMLVLLLDCLGIAAFAATGALVAGRHNMDLFGALTLAFVTGIGGGTLRDMILDAPVFWLASPHTLWSCLAGFALVYGGHRWVGHAHEGAINLLDAVGLAVFSVLGAAKALDLHHGPVIAVVMGFLTGCGGGMLRDVLAREIPIVLAQQRLYATPSLLGAAVFVLLAPHAPAAAMAAGFAVTLGLRLGSLIYNWRLPLFPAARA